MKLTRDLRLGVGTGLVIVGVGVESVSTVADDERHGRC